MRTVEPIDEERREPAIAMCVQAEQFPIQTHAAGRRAVHAAHVGWVPTHCSEAFCYRCETATAHGPMHERRLREPRHRRRHAGGWLRRIRRDDLEVTRVVECNQRVVRAASRMRTTERGTNARGGFELRARAIEMRCGQHEVIDVARDRRAQNGTPTARQRNCINGAAASKRFAMRDAKSFLNNSLSSIGQVAMKSVRFRSSTIG